MVSPALAPVNGSLQRASCFGGWIMGVFATIMVQPRSEGRSAGPLAIRGEGGIEGPAPDSGDDEEMTCVRRA